MTTEFIETVLAELSEQMDTWTTLSGVKQISLVGDRYVYTDPKHRLIYFSSNGSLYMKYLTGEIREKTSDDIPDDCVIISVNGKDYINPEAPYGVETSLGKIHAIIDFDNICGFLY